MATKRSEHYAPSQFAGMVARRYPKVTKYRYAYRPPLNSKRKFHGIKVWFLLFDPEDGHTYATLNFWHQTLVKTPAQWAEWLRTTGIDKIRDWWIPSHNSKFQVEREFIKLLLFHEQHRDKGRRAR